MQRFPLLHAILLLAALSSAPVRADQVGPASAMATRIKQVIMTDPAAAISALAEDRARAQTIADPRRRTLALATATWLEAEAQLRNDNLKKAASLIEQAERMVSAIAPRSELQAEILLTRGGLRASELGAAAAMSDFQSAFRLFQAAGNRRAEARALIYLSLLYMQAKDYTAVLRYTSQARDIYNGDPAIVLTILHNRAIALNELGRFSEAIRQYQDALVLARRIENAPMEAQVIRNIGRAQLEAGDIPAAERTMQAGYAVAAKTGSLDKRLMVAFAAQIALKQGRIGQAAALISRTFEGVDAATSSPSFREAHEAAVAIYRRVGNNDAALVHLLALKRIDDEVTKLATTTGSALMAARFDFANQELRIERLKRIEALRAAAFQRARAESERLIFLGGAAAVAVIIVLLLIGLFTIRRSRDQVRSVAADLARTNAALGKALAAKTEFLATTSHEIRTPLNGILGMTQVMLTDRAIAASTRERLEIVSAAGMTMKALVDDILDVAKMETGHLTLEDGAFDLAATLRDAVRLWEDQAASKGIGFRVDLSACPGPVMGDAARVRQVIFNLMSNAMKFTREGEVALIVRCEADRILMTVRDSGIGIPADKLGLVFESFRQVDAGTTREFGGTGLGLAICRNLVEAMGGTIAVESTVGRGSAFTVSIPLRRIAVTHDMADDAGGGEQHDLLIVERNPIARAMYKTLFAQRGRVPGFAGSAEEAASLLGRGGITDLLVDEATLAAGGDVGGGLALINAARGVAAATLVGIGSGTAPAGWQRLSKPISGARLAAAICDRPVASVPDALAGEAA